MFEHRSLSTRARTALASGALAAGIFIALFSAASLVPDDRVPAADVRRGSFESASQAGEPGAPARPAETTSDHRIEADARLASTNPAVQDASPQSSVPSKPKGDQEEPPTPWRDEPWYKRLEQPDQSAAEGEAIVPVNRLRVDASLDWTNAYYFRGALKEDTGVILQPLVELYANLSEPTDAVQFEAFLGSWSSIHGARTAATSSDGLTRYWYELDLYGGVSASWDEWTVYGTYYFYISPSGAFDTSHELSILAELDDSAMWSDGFALNPHAGLVIEAGGPPLTEPSRGVYLQLGIEPGFAWRVRDGLTLDVTLPVKVGLSVSDYYQDATGEDHRFGYFDAGVDASIELPPFGFGRGRLSAGAHWLHLGTTTSQLNSGRRDEFIGRLGVSYSF